MPAGTPAILAPLFQPPPEPAQGAPASVRSLLHWGWTMLAAAAAAYKPGDVAFLRSLGGGMSAKFIPREQARLYVGEDPGPVHDVLWRDTDRLTILLLDDAAMMAFEVLPATDLGAPAG